MNCIDNIDNTINEGWIDDKWNQLLNWGGRQFQKAGDWLTKKQPNDKKTDSPVSVVTKEPPEGVVIGQPAPFYKDGIKVGKFQIWYNKHFGGTLVIDGIWGKYTQTAWNDWVKKTFPDATKKEIKENKHNVQKYLNEETFKELVKEVIKESIK